ncbi:MAG: hypothetical protein K0S33_3138 [Bacteroidetes bacterium]|jgi:hypothetical protein|nr:hypothetical protein [Bacteroidota bacterium]
MMNEIVLCGLLAVYFIYSLKYSQEFYKTDTFYSKRQKTIHLILIWLLPFLWALLLKSMNRPLPDRLNKTSNESNL